MSDLLKKGVESAYSTPKHNTQVIEDVSAILRTLDEKVNVLTTPSIDS